MAVAVNKDPQVKVSAAPMGLVGASLVGTAYVVLGVLAVCYLLPWVWQAYAATAVQDTLGGFYNQGLLLLLMAGAAVGLVVVWRRTIGQRVPQGTRAGIFLTLFWLAVALVTTYVVLWLVEKIFTLISGAETVQTNGPFLGGAVILGMAIFWVRFLYRRFTREKYLNGLQATEEQGWFTFKPYKRGQGLRIRRLTMLGLLLLIGTGLWFYRGAPNLNVWWSLTVPFFRDTPLALIPAPGVTVPVLLGLGALWFVYRLVNWPRFADFLVATEAEMHKVSWATGKRLKQDTIVVLTTVVLMTVFLFSMDTIWSQVLKWVGVIHTPGKQSAPPAPNQPPPANP